MYTPQKLAFLQGYVDIFERSPLGKAVKGVWQGNVPTFSLSASVEKDELAEAYSGQSSTVSTVTTKKTLSGTFTSNDYSLKQFLRNFQASHQQVAAGTFTGEVIGDLEEGEVFYLPYVGLTSATLSDGSGALTAGEDYSVNLKTGRCVALTALTGVTADGAYGASEAAGIFAADEKNYVFVCSCINKTDGKPYLVRLYNIRIDPASDVAFIGNTHNSYQVNFTVLLDELKPVDAVLGQFGEMRTIA